MMLVGVGQKSGERAVHRKSIILVKAVIFKQKKTDCNCRWYQSFCVCLNRSLSCVDFMDDIMGDILLFPHVNNVYYI